MNSFASSLTYLPLTAMACEPVGWVDARKPNILWLVQNEIAASQHFCLSAKCLSVMKEKVYLDSTHLAYASCYNIDYLLTWNCNHLANVNEKKHIRIINGRLGLQTPEIITPLELFKEENEND
jgi:hypothetical protein